MYSKCSSEKSFSFCNTDIQSTCSRKLKLGNKLKLRNKFKLGNKLKLGNKFKFGNKFKLRNKFKYRADLSVSIFTVYIVL